jgi:hypothetical protein
MLPVAPHVHAPQVAADHSAHDDQTPEALLRQATLDAHIGEARRRGQILPRHVSHDDAGCCSGRQQIDKPPDDWRDCDEAGKIGNFT